MKKILTSLFLISVTTYSFGQSLRLYNGATDITNTTITIPITANTSQANDIDIHNITSSPVNFKIRRTIVSPPLDSNCSVYFCTGITCYSPSTNAVYTGNNAVTLNGNTNLTGSQGLIAHFDVGPSCCDNTYIKYQAFVVGVTGDTATFTIHYSCASGINDLKKSGSISNAYPNPANSLIAINYEVNDNTNGKIIIYDMLGKQVKEFTITDKQGIAKINVADLNAGIYFYSFVIDGKAIATKKLVISSR